MTLYVRTPYGRFPRFRHTHRYAEDFPYEESEVFFPVDVKVEEDGFVITALLPGLTAEDINIQVVNENVSLHGEFKANLDPDATYILQERPSGKFFRTITLPDAVDASKADASMENGVLTLRIPKAEEAKPKTIKITKK